MSCLGLCKVNLHTYYRKKEVDEMVMEAVENKPSQVKSEDKQEKQDASETAKEPAAKKKKIEKEEECNAFVPLST